MDHKVSKDMISSGMIPSGEKTQADLGRIQYGSNPSPSSLADAYKSMYGKKEEVINEMRLIKPSFKNLSGRQKRIQKTPRGGSQGSGVYDATTGGKNDSQSIDAKVSNVSGPGQGKPMVGKVTTRKVDPQTLKKNPRGDIQTNSFDLLASYKSMYEHHKKDADGNTIPHEGEEINEVVFTGGAMLAGLAAKKLLGAAAAKGLKAGATMLAKKAAVKTMGMGARGALKTISKKGLAGAADKALGSAAMSTVKNPVNTMVGASLLKPTPKIPTPIDRSKKMTGARTAGVYASADLFDIVKGQLLDEGIDEKEALKIMVELSQQDLNTIVNEGIGQMKLLPTLAGLAGGAVATQQIASRMGKKSGEESIKPNKPKKPGLIQQIKTSTDAKNKAIEQM